MDTAPGRNVVVKYQEAPGYKKVGATGVYGGVTPTGHILCHFFMDWREIPPIQEHTIQPDGALITKELSDTLPVIIRELQVGVLFAPQIAKSIGEWLIQQSDIVIQAQADNLG